MAINGILFNNDELISSLYELNLAAYVGIKLTICQKATDAQNSISNKTKIVIIGFTEKNVKDATAVLAKANSTPNVKIICFNADGKKNTSSLVPQEVIFLSNRFDVRNFNRTCARVLEVTAAQMSKIVVGDYFQIPTVLLTNSAVAQWNIYQEKEFDAYEQIAKEGDSISSLATSLIDQKIGHVFVEARDRLRCINDISSRVILHARDAAAPEKLKAAEVSYDSLVAKFCANDHIKSRMDEITKACDEAIKEMVNKHADVKDLLKFLHENKSGYLFSHSVLMTFITSHIVSKVPWGNQQLADKLSIACFFHDMYLAPIYENHPELREEEEILYHPSLSEDERELVAMHARYAGEKVESMSNIPMGVSTIITQHHGSKSGEGIMIGPSNEISPLAKVMQVAESYTNVYLEAARKKTKITHEEFVVQLKKQYAHRSYDAIIGALATLPH